MLLNMRLRISCRAEQGARNEERWDAGQAPLDSNVQLEEDPLEAGAAAEEPAASDTVMAEGGAAPAVEEGDAGYASWRAIRRAVPCSWELQSHACSMRL